MARVNRYGQAIGDAVLNWAPPPAPERTPIRGTRCDLEPLDIEAHCDALYEANARGDGSAWTYLFAEPPASREAYAAYLADNLLGLDPLCHAIIDRASGAAVGVASYLRITPAHGCIEVGHINFSPALQRTPIATEAMYLMMRHVFELGYRRYEWKCDALNAPSRAAAQRLGFSFEGVFRKAIVYKGRSRDTAWFSITDDEWPAVRAAFEQWLAPGNFDAHGSQRVQLRWLTAPLLRAVG
ncbi:MAG: GNAT family N-acetyltransferase [Gemmatimonadaceae bacterium]|nr:GNAT family N-acetyltransferase [Gemmatimonadaceae bacterium]